MENIKNYEDLNEAQKKIFQVLINPENLTNTKAENARLAEVNIKTLYKYLRDSEFMEYVNKYQFEQMNRDVYLIYQSLFKSALLEGKNGDNARKLYLELLGKHTEKLEVTNKPNYLLVDFVPPADSNDSEFGTRIE